MDDDDEKEHVATFIPSLYHQLLKKTSCDVSASLKQGTEREMICDMQNQIKNFVKKTGDTVSGNLHILKYPEDNADAANKEYVDHVFSNVSSELKVLESKLGNNSDLDLNFFNIKNLNNPTDVNDAVNKNYVDKKFNILQNSQYIQDIFSKGQIVPSVKKTFFFNPGFICPRKIHIVSVGLSTSPYKYKIGEKLKLGEINPTKLYFMINNEIKSEYPIEKDIQLGYVLKEFDDPIIFEKEDNVMMVIENMIEDTSVNVSFY
jgi:hypothetical protein